MTLKIDIKNNKISFTEEQVVLLQNTLDASIEGDICIPKKTLFEEIQKHFPMDMELYQFEFLLTKAIRSDIIKGYDIKQGRGGGVCRCGTHKTRNDKVKVTFNNKTFVVKSSDRKILSRFLEIAKEGNAGKGNIFVGNKLYSLPENLNTLDFLEKILSKGKK